MIFGENQALVIALVAVIVPMIGTMVLAWRTQNKVDQVHIMINSEFTKFKEMIAEKELARGNLEGRAQLLREQAEVLGAAAVAREGEAK